MKSKLQKREEAAVRQAEYDTLSVEDKLARIAQRPGSSARELAKLQAQLAKAA